MYMQCITAVLSYKTTLAKGHISDAPR